LQNSRPLSLHLFSQFCVGKLIKISSFSSLSLYLETEHPFLESKQQQNSENSLFTHGFYCFLQKNIYTSLKPTVPIRLAPKTEHHTVGTPKRKEGKKKDQINKKRTEQKNLPELLSLSRKPFFFLLFYLLF
jgi:hypothetical protein